MRGQDSSSAGGPAQDNEELAYCPLVVRAGPWGHDQGSVEDLVAVAVVWRLIEILQVQRPVDGGLHGFQHATVVRG
ncbi:MAG: hypothetical protein ACRDYY_17530 [Acidimicrobiales bacterium]